MAAQFETNRTYSIEARSSGRFLNGRNSTGIIFNHANSNNESEWNIIDNGDGTFRLVCKKSDEVLSVQSGATVSGALLITEAWTATEQQKWILTEEDKFALLILNNKLAADPDYEIKEKTSQNIVLSGTMSLVTADTSATWHQYYYKADISALSAKGQFY